MTVKQRSAGDLISLTARDVMARHALCLTPEMGLRQALDRLTRGMITGAPVIDDAGRPIGVLSLSDFVGTPQGGAERDLYYSSADYEDIGEIADKACSSAALDFDTVEGAMTRLVIVAHPDDRLADVARIMARRRVHRVIITDKGKVVGVISSMDIVRAFATAGESSHFPARRSAHRISRYAQR